MKKISNKKRAEMAIAALKSIYPQATCSLNYKKPYELLIATRLSAQCTDARVNIVTKDLFSKYKTLQDLANASVDDIADVIKSCGLFKTKARDIVAIANDLINKYNGIVPDTIEELTTLSGVGRKTANLIIGDIYHKPAVVVDTHCIRITNRIGLVHSNNQTKIELELKSILPPNESNDFCHRLVLHGRDTCKAKSPDCDSCILNSSCEYGISKKPVE